MPKYKFQRDKMTTLEEIQDMIDTSPLLWLKAIIALLYIYGPRIEEALMLAPEDFTKTDQELIIEFNTEKRRDVHGPYKYVPRILRANLELTPFIDHLVFFVDTVRKLGATRKVWPVSRSYVWKLLKRLNPKISPHVFRHDRLMKLALQGATGPQLREWAGWRDLRPASYYLSAVGQLSRALSDKIK